jgi:hypothetical protein
MLVKRRDDLLTTPRPEFLATPEEMRILARIEAVEARLAADGGASEQTVQRLQRLKGILSYTLQTEYHARLTEFDKNVRGLDEVMAIAQTEYDEYVRNRQAATHSYEGYDQPMRRLRAEVDVSVDKIDQLMARQGHLLEELAIDELVARREHLEDYGDKARFALADSYDRATQAQAKLGEAP